MTDKDRRKVLAKLEWEDGYEYFINGSSFPEIKDKEFRRLVDNFRKAHGALKAYLGDYEL
jgi:hypothetical protein